MKNKIAFGTASLGIANYGISNRELKEDPKKILDRIFESGVDSFDVARSYGLSEEIIGKWLAESNNTVWLSTKVDGITLENYNSDYLLEQVNVSKKLMNVGTIDLVYLHQNNIEIFSNKNVIDDLLTLKKNGLCQEVGVSIYTKNELLKAVELGVYDWIQLPSNILDTSLLRAAKEICKSKIAVRSIFLQGAFFSKNLKSYRGIPGVEGLDEGIQLSKILAQEYRIQLETMMVSYIYGFQQVEQVILGSRNLFFNNSINDLVINLPEDLVKKLDKISEKQKEWTNPRSWK